MIILPPFHSSSETLTVGRSSNITLLESLSVSIKRNQCQTNKDNFNVFVLHIIYCFSYSNRISSIQIKIVLTSNKEYKNHHTILYLHHFKSRLILQIYTKNMIFINYYLDFIKKNLFLLTHQNTFLY